MLDMLLLPVAIFYLLVVGLLFIYGSNFYYLAFLSWKHRDQSKTARDLGAWPSVTIQLPIYNELYVAERLIRAAAKVAYPSNLLEIQVLDDSIDETREIARNTVESLRSEGHHIRYITRSNRLGYKAGALASGLDLAKGEFLAVFDADFIPTPDFLYRTIPFFNNPKVGFVQSRWGHTNQDYSLLTLLQSLAIDAHFMIEQYARNMGGYWFNFNGTAGVWRRSALEDAGGWQADTLTEDLDLSYRVLLKGWQGEYVRDVVVRAELPVSINAYRRQQHRWARGSMECAIKHLPSIWQAPVSLGLKLESTLHLTGYCVHLLLFALALLYPLVILLNQQYENLITLFGIAVVFNITAFAPTLFFILAQQQLGKRWFRSAPLFLLISAFGAGMMLNTVRAALHMVSNQPGIFERTPKFGILNRRQVWVDHRYQLRLDPIVYFELAFALFNFATMSLALSMHNWAIAAYAGVFAAGLLLITGITFTQAIATRHNTLQHLHQETNH